MCETGHWYEMIREPHHVTLLIVKSKRFSIAKVLKFVLDHNISDPHLPRFSESETLLGFGPLFFERGQIQTKKK